MPLYRCTKCNVVENTALGGYWMQQADAQRTGTKHKPLCSQCDPAIGEWHGRFPRETVTANWLQDPRGHLWRPSEIEKVPQLGPFQNVEI